MALIDDLRSLLEAYGLGSLAGWVVSQEVEGKDDLTIITELRQRPEYKRRFPAMEALQRKMQDGYGVGITEGDYLALEASYRQAFAMSGLPQGMYDSPDDFSRLIEADVSPDEVRRRISAAQEAADSTDPNTRAMLRQYYGITATDLMAYALDPERNSDYIQRIAATSILSGYARSAGLGDLGRSSWEAYSQDLLNQGLGDEDLRSIISESVILADSQRRLAEMEGDSFSTSDALDITIRKDADKMVAANKRIGRERARFGGSSGLNTGSLAGEGI